MCISCLPQVQAGKGINISARTFHLAQGDILKVNRHFVMALSLYMSDICLDGGSSTGTEPQV